MELEGIVRRDLLAPAGGPEEAVGGRHIVGLLAPGVSGRGSCETVQGARHTITEAARRVVPGRLLELNHQQYATGVVARLHEKGHAKANDKDRARSGSARKDTTKTSPDVAPRLFD